jgi:hypothetical protein
MVELLEYLRHANVDVRKKAIEALFQYSTNDQCIKALTIDVVKSLKSALYELVPHFPLASALPLPLLTPRNSCIRPS